MEASAGPQLDTALLKERTVISVSRFSVTHPRTQSAHMGFDYIFFNVAIRWPGLLNGGRGRRDRFPNED